jgi:hypothetical protein
MPGTLPPDEAYMYAADFSLDEAKAAGATNVQFSNPNFSQPVISYTQNYLNFPVGLQIPSLSFDQKKGTWVEGSIGRAIKILSATNGMADLDVDGSGQPADAATLTSMGITDAERQEILQLYNVGQVVWRVQLNHFTNFDY